MLQLLKIVTDVFSKNLTFVWCLNQEKQKAGSSNNLQGTDTKAY